MARLALILVLASTPAAARPVALELGVADGLGWASRAGAYRDDGSVALRVDVALARSVGLDLALREDVERVEPAFGAGARFAVDRSLYVRGELAVVGGSDLGSNYDATAAIGYAHGWYAELAAVDRFGELDTLSLHVEVGVGFDL